MLCDHCGTVEKAMTIWPKDVHETCQCLCHYWRSKRGRDELAERKKESKRRKKKV